MSMSMVTYFIFPILTDSLLSSCAYQTTCYLWLRGWWVNLCALKFKGPPGLTVQGHRPHSACSDSRGQRSHPSSPALGRSQEMICSSPVQWNSSECNQQPDQAGKLWTSEPCQCLYLEILTENKNVSSIQINESTQWFLTSELWHHIQILHVHCTTFPWTVWVEVQRVTNLGVTLSRLMVLWHFSNNSMEKRVFGESILLQISLCNLHLVQNFLILSQLLVWRIWQ